MQVGFTRVQGAIYASLLLYLEFFITAYCAQIQYKLLFKNSFSITRIYALGLLHARPLTYDNLLRVLLKVYTLQQKPLK